MEGDATGDARSRGGSIGIVAPASEETGVIGRLMVLVSWWEPFPRSLSLGFPRSQLYQHGFACALGVKTLRGKRWPV